MINGIKSVFEAKFNSYSEIRIIALILLITSEKYQRLKKNNI